MQWLKVLKINHEHSKTETAALCRILSLGNIDINLIQDPWLTERRVGEIESKIIYNFVKTLGSQAVILFKFYFRDQTAIRLKLQVAER